MKLASKIISLAVTKPKILWQKHFKPKKANKTQDLVNSPLTLKTFKKLYFLVKWNTMRELSRYYVDETYQAEKKDEKNCCYDKLELKILLRF